MRSVLSWPLLLKQGRTWAHVAAVTRREIEDFARSLPQKKHAAVRIIRGKECDTKENLLKEFARALEFPEYFGQNWDALEDCMKDLEWLSSEGYVFFVANAEAVLARDDESFAMLASILKETAEVWRNGEHHTPFHMVFHCESAQQSELTTRLRNAGITVL